MIPTRWTADKIRQMWRAGRTPVVMQRGGEYFNLGLKLAARLEGDYMVNEKPHEIIVDLNTQRKQNL